MSSNQSYYTKIWITDRYTCFLIAHTIQQVSMGGWYKEMGNTCFRCYVSAYLNYGVSKPSQQQKIQDNSANCNRQLLQHNCCISALKRVKNVGRNEFHMHVQYLIRIIQLIFNNYTSKLLYRVPMTTHITSLMLIR